MECMKLEEEIAREKIRTRSETIEAEFFGKWTIILRNIGGITAGITTCVIAIFNAFTTHVSVSNGGLWPSELTMLIVNIGPVLIAWSYMKANKMVETIVQMGGVRERIRQSIADIIIGGHPPPPDQPRRRNTDLRD